MLPTCASNGKVSGASAHGLMKGGGGSRSGKVSSVSVRVEDLEPSARFQPQAHHIRQLFQPLNHRAAKYPILHDLSVRSNFR
jgi:hypothetical protein